MSQKSVSSVDSQFPNTQPDTQPDKQATCLTVAIGSSAGGLSAIRELIKSYPSDLNAAIIITQHMSADHKTQLPEILSKQNKVKNLVILLAEDGMLLQANYIYIIPAGKSAQIRDGRFNLKDIEQRNLHLIDDLFCSIADELKENAVGVILSGTGHDGTLGSSALRDHGALTIAQDEASAEFPDMPHSAIQNKLVDLVLRPAEVLPAIVQYQNKRTEELRKSSIDQISPETLVKLFEVLRRQSGIDFSKYKLGTVLRRMTKRLSLSGLGNIESYVQLLESSPVEADHLAQDFLINVTQFFRDQNHFEALQQILPDLLNPLGRKESLRIWVPGCSTGEEAYSLAIVLKEYMKANNIEREFVIFATDVDDSALNLAREGNYTESSVASVPENYLTQYFDKSQNVFSVKKEIRSTCVFAKQNVISDPPFSRIDFISCRNLFIYFNQDLQKRVLEIFNYALKPKGFLFLGSSESIAPDISLFTAVDKQHRIFASKENSQKRAAFSGRAHLWDRLIPKGFTTNQLSEQPRPKDLRTEVLELVLPRLEVVRIVINKQLNIVFTEGPVEKVLQIPNGVTNLNLLKMARTGLGWEFRAAISKALDQQKAISRKNIQVSNEDQNLSFDLEAVPFHSHDSSDNLVLLIIEESRNIQPLILSGDPGNSSVENRRLQQELLATREFLHSMIEQQDSTHEELKVAHDEIVTRNEELQSSNEELETTKEELQAGNEELTTLNDELLIRNQELQQLNLAVKVSEEKYRSLTESALDAVITTDSDGIVEMWNSGAEKMFQYKAAEILGKNVSETVPQRYRAAHVAGMKRVSQGGVPRVIGKTVEVVALRKDTSEFPIELSLSSWTVNGKMYFTSIIRDISERAWNRNLQSARVEIGHSLLLDQSIEEALEQTIKIICQNMGYKLGTFWKFNPSRNTLDWKKMWPAATGALADFAESHSQLSFVKGQGVPGAVWDDKAIWIESLNSDPRFIRKEIFKSLELNTGITFPIGSSSDFYGIIEVFNEAMIKPEPRVLALFDEIGSYLNQFVRRKMAEEKLKHFLSELEIRIEERTRELAASEARQRFLAEASSVLSRTVKLETMLQEVAELCIPYLADWSVVDIAQGAGEMNRVAIAHRDPKKVEFANELNRRYPTDPESPHGPPNVIKTGKSEIMIKIPAEVIEATAKDKEHLSLLQSLNLNSYICVPIVAKGNTLGTITFIYSDSGKSYSAIELELAEQLGIRAGLAIERAQLVEKLHLADKAKDEFLATLSHELRTPMNIIMGWTEILNEDSDKETVAAGVEVLQRNSKIQLRLINDLLDISRIISGKALIEFEEVEIIDLATSAIKGLESEAHKKDLKIKLFTKEKAVLVNGDSSRIIQVLNNIFSNAIKFTPNGGDITTTIDRVSSGVEIRIQDTGIGIEQQFLDHVFETFRQEDGSLTRQYGGLGLGLAISKHIIDQHKGKIVAFSKGKGHGAMFTITLPTV